jgi:hypothetical protein
MPLAKHLANRHRRRSLRVRRVTFLPYTRRIYAASIRMTGGFESIGPLAPRADALYAVRVPRAGSLPSASFGFRLAADTLAVRLGVPVIKASIGTCTRPVASRSAFARRLTASGYDAVASCLTQQQKSPMSLRHRAFISRQTVIRPRVTSAKVARGNYLRAIVFAARNKSRLSVLGSDLAVRTSLKEQPEKRVSILSRRHPRRRPHLNTLDAGKVPSVHFKSKKRQIRPECLGDVASASPLLASVRTGSSAIGRSVGHGHLNATGANVGNEGGNGARLWTLPRLGRARGWRS